MLSGYQGTFQGPPRRREVALMRWQVRAAERWKGTELYSPFYKTICRAPCISPGPVSAEQRTARCDASAAARPFPAPWGERDRVPALAGTDGVPEGFAPSTPADRPRGGCGLRRGRRGDDALLNKAGSFGGLLPLLGALQAGAEGVSPSAQMTFSGGHGASDVPLFALFPVLWCKEEMLVWWFAFKASHLCAFSSARSPANWPLQKCFKSRLPYVAVLGVY